MQQGDEEIINNLELLLDLAVLPETDLSDEMTIRLISASDETSGILEGEESL